MTASTGGNPPDPGQGSVPVAFLPGKLTVTKDTP
jgi:hypothetical protein